MTLNYTIPNLSVRVIVSWDVIPDGVEVQGKAYADYPSGTQIINVLYETTDLQESYMNCQVGALVETNMVDCFANDGVFNIDGDEYAYTYNMETDNKAARTM